MAKRRPATKLVYEPPRYREAHPSFDIVAATAAFARGDTICEFQDRFDDPLGVARFDLRGDRCQLEYHVIFPYGVTSSSWKQFDLSHVAHGDHSTRVTIVCPDCEAKFGILYFKDRWSCASCLGLAYRSQLIHPLARKWEKHLALSNKLKNGKPRGIHHKTYEKLLRKLEQEREELYSQDYRSASSKFADVLHYTWRASLPKDGYYLSSLRADGTLAKQVAAQRAIEAQRLLSPSLILGEEDHPLRGDYETDEPGEM